MRAHFLAIAGVLLSIGEPAPSVAAPRDRFFWLSQINKASAVMIVERGIVPKPLGARIFDAINRVDAAGDQPGAVRSGDYLKVEQDLMAAGGPDISPLHSGRSRQDIGSTTQRLITRDDFLTAFEKLNGLREAILALAAQAPNAGLATSGALTLGAPIADITTQYAETEPWIVLTEGSETGVSSIMPQKRNPSGLVRLRAEASTLIGEADTFSLIAHNVEAGMSDYKDFGNPKEYPNVVLRDMAALFAHADAVIGTMRFRPVRALDEVNSDYSTTTELADTLQRKADVPFRIGHHFASELVNYGRGHHLRASEIPYAEAQRIYAEIATAAQMATRLSLSEEQFRRALTAENMVAASQGLGATRTKLADAAQRLDQTFMRLHD
jgi:argininosuccinate lyase